MTSQGKAWRGSLRMRSFKGANLMEFAAAFSVLILFVIFPLVSLCAIPIRMSFASAAVQDTGHHISLCSKFSEAKSGLRDRLQSRLSAISGVSLILVDLSLVAVNSHGSSSIFTGSVPESWLPDSKDGPFHYNLRLTCELDVAPLFTVSLGDMNIPGLSGPFRARIQESFAWENLSKDPVTKQFYLNE